MKSKNMEMYTVNMKNSSKNQKILEKLKRRKNANENPCEECGGSGHASFSTGNQILACGLCLGEGVRLTSEEQRLLKERVLTGYRDDDDDSILDTTELH